MKRNEDGVSVGMLSLAVSFPPVVRTNEYFRTNHAAVVAEAEKKSLARVWSKSDVRAQPTNAHDIEMLPYLEDPFRGTVERRVLEPGQTALALESSAARKALKAAGMTPGDVEHLLVVSFMPDQPGFGNAAFLARELGIVRPAWNIESTCAGAYAAFQAATALVQSGQCGTVLVVVSCTYSRASDYNDTLSWFLGDGAGAFVVGRVAKGTGLLGYKSVATTDTCEAFHFKGLSQPVPGNPGIALYSQKETGRIIGKISEPTVRACCEGAVAEADVSMADIDALVVNTPTAWYAAMGARALGVDKGRTVDTYPLYANIGPALMPVNLHHAVQEGRVRPGSLVLVYAIGTISTAGAFVMRWGDTKLGPPAEPATTRL